MKAGRSLQDLAAELQRQAASKKDWICDTRALSVRPPDKTGDPVNSIILEGINGGMPLRETAHNQMATTLGIDKRYYDRMKANAPDLLATNINHWLKAEPKKRMIRTLDGGVRAILSDRYRPLDNLDLVEAVLPRLGKLEAEVVSGEVTESRFYLKAVTPKVQGVVERINHRRHDTIGKVNDVIQMGLVISNSEIGDGSLKVEEMTYRLICLNGAIHAAITRKTHTGRRATYADADLMEQSSEFFRDETRAADDRAFFLKVQDAVAGVLTQERLDFRIKSMTEATGRKIEADPVQVVEVVSKRFGLGEKERGSILKELIQGADLTQYGLAQAVTRMSQDVESYDAATALEAIGAQVLELPAAEWKVLAV